MSDQKPDSSDEHVIHITQLRDCLGVAYSHVKTTGEPIIIQRYNDPEVALVPLWEWRFLKEVEAKIRAGQQVAHVGISIVAADVPRSRAVPLD